MYTKDKKYVVTLRLNPEQYGYLKGTADSFGVTPAQWLRIIIDLVRTGDKHADIQELRDSQL